MNDAMLSVGMSQLSSPQIYGKHVIVVCSYPTDLIWRPVVSVLQASVSCHCNLWKELKRPPMWNTDVLDSLLIKTKNTSLRPWTSVQCIVAQVVQSR